MNRPSFVPRDFVGKCKVFPQRNVMLLPFQERWVKDNSRLKIAEKARQCGWSWATAYRLVREKLKAGARLDAGALRAWMLARTERFKVPDSFIFRDVLPVGPSGKIDRRALAPLLLEASNQEK